MKCTPGYCSTRAAVTHHHPKMTTVTNPAANHAQTTIFNPHAAVILALSIAKTASAGVTTSSINGPAGTATWISPGQLFVLTILLSILMIFIVVKRWDKHNAASQQNVKGGATPARDGGSVEHPKDE